MVFKNIFTLLVATATTPFFAFVLIISENHCRYFVHETNPVTLPPFSVIRINI